MAQWDVYLDASGSTSDPGCRVLTVAGYAATETNWRSFETVWQKILDEFGVTHLHMKHFAHSRGEFLSWKGNESIRADFLKKLTDTIRAHELEDFSVSLNLSHYRSLDRRYRLSETLGAYGLVATTAIGKIDEWQRRRRSGDAIRFLLEKGDAGQDSIRRLPANTGLQPGPEPLFITKKWTDGGIEKFCVPMQASDLLAYEHAKCLTDAIVKGKTHARESLFRLSYRQAGPGEATWTYLDRRFLLGACATFNVAGRS